jgi:hypothetical protein
MAFTILAAPSHVMPQSISMPTLRDPVGNGTMMFRRLQKRPLSSWELVVPGRQELLDPILGLLEHMQGDTPFWFDGAGFGEVVTPILVGIGIANTTDYDLPHRYVFVSSLVIYINGSFYQPWTPLGGDGITCDMIRFTGVINPNYPITAKYRRRIKCVLRTEEKTEMARSFRSSVASENIHRLKYVIEEVAT